MNAKILERLISFRTKRGLETVKVIIDQKIRYQYQVISKSRLADKYSEEIKKVSTNQELLLVEARAAKEYWGYVRQKIENKVVWSARIPHNGDVVNQLLDIGYHYLTGHVLKIFQEVDMPTEIGMYHKAQSKHAHPLVYDFIEWLRPITVDRVLLVFVGKKKKMFESIQNKDIGMFVQNIKQVFEKKLYNKKLTYCITLDYWVKLIILELESAINHDTVFEPLFPSMRHETRCK
jgi:CRISPR-associated endonuclease Cas1